MINQRRMAILIITAADTGLILIGWIGNDTKVVEDRILKVLIGAQVGDTKEVVIQALLDKMNDTNDNASDAGIMPISQVDIGTKLVVDGKVLKVLTVTRVGDAKQILTEACQVEWKMLMMWLLVQGQRNKWDKKD